VTVADDVVAPTVPTNVRVTNTTATSIGLAWTASSDNVGVARYQVVRCIGTTCTPTTWLANVTGTSYTNSGLSSKKTYRYRIRAQDAAGNMIGYSTTVQASTK
jgi:chitodextrinase